MEGRTYGLEAWGAYAITDRWRLSASFTALHKDLKLKPGVRDIFGVLFAGNDPAREATLRSRMNLTDRVELDLGLRAVSRLPSPPVAPYVEADARLGWRVTDGVEVSLQAFNALNDQHIEFVNGSLPRREFQRAIQVGARLSF